MQPVHHGRRRLSFGGQNPFIVTCKKVQASSKNRFWLDFESRLKPQAHAHSETSWHDEFQKERKSLDGDLDGIQIFSDSTKDLGEVRESPGNDQENVENSSENREIENSKGNETAPKPEIPSEASLVGVNLDENTGVLPYRSVLSNGDSPLQYKNEGANEKDNEEETEESQATFPAEFLSPSRLKAAKKRNEFILRSKSVDEVLEIWERSGQNFSLVNTSTAFHRIGKIMKGMKLHRRAAVREDPRLKSLAQTIDKLVPIFDDTALRAVCWAHQTSHIGSPLLPILCLQFFERNMHKLRKKSFSGTLLSLLAMDQITSRTLDSLSDGITKWLSDRLAHPDWPQLYLRDVSDILWSFAVTDHDNISVTILLSKFAKQTLATPKPEDTDLLNLARVSWGFSKLRFCDEALFDSLAQAALKRLQNIDLSGNEVGNSYNTKEDQLSTYARLAWGLARGFSLKATENQTASDLAWQNDLGANEKLRQDYVNNYSVRHEVMEALCQRFHPRIEKAKWLDIKMMLSALSYLNFYNNSFMQSTDSWILQNYEDLNIQAVANIMWSYATLGHDSPYVLEKLAGQARELLKARADSFSAEGANAFIMACAKLGVDNMPQSHKLVAASARWFIRKKGEYYVHRNIPLVMQGLAQVEIIADDYLREAYEMLSHQQYTWNLNKARLYEADFIFRVLQPSEFPIEEYNSRIQDFRFSAERAWQKFQRDAYLLIEGTAEDISSNLKRLGFKSATQERLEGYILDVSLQNLKFAIQVLGPGSFANNTRRPLGFKRAKQTMLEIQGWRVLNVIQPEWQSLSTWEEKGRYLRHNLETRGIQIAKTSEALELAA